MNYLSNKQPFQTKLNAADFGVYNYFIVMSAILFLWCTPGREVAITTVGGGKDSIFGIFRFSFAFFRIFPIGQTFERPGCLVVFKMAAKGGLRLGQAVLRRTILRPQVVLGIRKGWLWTN